MTEATDSQPGRMAPGRAHEVTFEATSSMTATARAEATDGVEHRRRPASWSTAATRRQKSRWLVHQNKKMRKIRVAA